MGQNWKIHKFGGTSVLNAERYRGVFEIVKSSPRQGKQAIVLSAMKGVTDDLIETVRLASSKDKQYSALLARVQSRHEKEIAALLSSNAAQPLLDILKQDFLDLSEILRGIWLLKEASQAIVERVSGMGEVWSAQILDAYFREKGARTSWLDARQVLIIHRVGVNVVVDWEKSRSKLKNWLTDHPAETLLITGFVASTESGAATTLGRNGSDFSASIFASLLSADEITLWTDVNGILSADPRQVPEAIVLSEMSYHEVMELAYFGANVVHPATLTPAFEKKIPIRIKDTFHPELPGTLIHSDAKSDRTVKGFSTIHHMALINLEGAGMVGVPGVAERLFSSLRQAGVNVVLISQASSEQSICIAILESQCEAAGAAIAQVFAIEIQKALIELPQITKGVSILAAVGDQMANSPGVAGRLFTALGQAGVNIRAIAQGSSERNISVVIDSQDSMRALRTVHSSFILPHQRVSIGLIGPGKIGETFLRQLQEKTNDLRVQNQTEFQIRAIANSKRMLLADKEIPLENWRAAFDSNSEPLDLVKFSQHVNQPHIPHSVIIEASASETLVPFYKKWLAQGIHVISPNKKSNAGSMEEYRAIRIAAQTAHRHFLYSTHVGAGLPIIQTLRDLCATGDRVSSVLGILSGTLSYLFNEFDESTPFSSILLKARSLGYTEPDPREDLSGQDVARKLVILAREAGLSIELADVQVESLIPDELSTIALPEFLNRLPELDAIMTRKIIQAQSENNILRYVATLEPSGAATVGLKSLPRSHVFSRAKGTDNIVLFQTQRYPEPGLIIQGPGAGPDVTAAGVFSDLLRLSRYLGSLS